MQFKLVPDPPTDLEFLETVHEAVPLVPGDENDCCARIMGRTDVFPRDEARTWLTFLRALGLATEGPVGFSRVNTTPNPDRLRSKFVERIHGVDVVLEILDSAETGGDDDGGLSATAVYEAFRDRGTIPHYERHKYPDRLDDVWGERVRRILEWGVLFDLIERADGGYRLADDAREVDT